jgi:hypothetical protein
MLLQRERLLGSHDSLLISPSSCSSMLPFAPPLLMMLMLLSGLLSSQHLLHFGALLCPWFEAHSVVVSSSTSYPTSPSG